MRQNIKALKDEKNKALDAIANIESNLLGSEVRKEIRLFIESKYNPAIESLEKRYQEL